MSRSKRLNFKPEFRLEDAQLVLDKDYSIREAAEAMEGINKRAMIVAEEKWCLEYKST